MRSFQAMGPGTLRRDGISRRDVLRVGGLSALGLGLPQLMNPLRTIAAGVPHSDSGAKARSCIVLFLSGGPPQHSTWDPKPDAPIAVRGEIGSIATNVPGTFFGELMPRLATQAHKLAVLRSISTNDNAHSSSGYYMLTGQPHTPPNAENVNPGSPNDWPNWGSVIQTLCKQQDRLPASVRLPGQISNTDGSIWPGQDGGMLGHRVDPWLIRYTAESQGFSIGELRLPSDVSPERLTSRQKFVQTIDHRIDADRFRTYAEQQRKAYGVLSSAVSRGAFDLTLEDNETRHRYGKSPFGQSCLLARRLVEADVRLVQVNWYRGPDEPADNPCWDSHSDETRRLRNVLMPPMDQGFSALLEDLSERGLLDETLVVCMSEFGRAPTINKNGGRDHWGAVFSVAMGGGGIRGGTVYGSSDPLGAYSRTDPVRLEDVTATMFHCLGYSPDMEFTDRQNRRHSLSRGNVIRQILT